MKAARRRPQPAKWRYVPIGFYANRPQLAAKLIAAGIGHVENVRFVTSSSLPIMNESWVLPIEHIVPPRP